MIDREVMQTALDALTEAELDGNCEYGATDALRTALAQPEPEPVAYLTKRKVSGIEGLLRANMVDISAKNKETHDFIPLYTAPPKKEWVGLTDKEYETMAEQYVTNCYFDTLKYAKAIEAKLKEKNK